MHRTLPRLLLILLSLAAFFASPGESFASSTRLTVEEVLQTHAFRELAVSPDGRWLVYVLRRADEEENRAVDELWRVELDEPKSEPLLLVSANGDLGSLEWSPDSKRVGFLMKRGEEAETQVWAIAPDGGEARALSDWEPGVEAFHWAGDARILYAAKEKPTLRERKLEEKKDDSRVVEDPEHPPHVRLFSLDPESGETRRMVNDERPISDFWVSRDGRRVVTRHLGSQQHESQVGGPWPVYLLHELDRGRTRPIFEEPTFAPSRVAFDPDGEGLWAQTTHSRLTTVELRSGAGIEALWHLELDTQSLERVDEEGLGLADHLIGPAWEPVGDGVAAILADRVHGTPVLFERKGDRWRRRELKAPRGANWLAWSFARENRRLAWVLSSAGSPEELWTGELRGDTVGRERRLADPDASLRPKLTRSEPWSWTSRLDGVEISGILHWPKDYQDGRRYPLMVWIHGGPTGVDADRFENYWASFPHLLAGMGCFVLQPNYRGSVNHGLDYVEAITGGRYYEYELPDILDGVDALIETGRVHPDSLGTIGWSNGAILSIALTVETDRFRVCCAGAGDVNWSSDFGNCAFGPNFEVLYLGAAPWEDPQIYVEKSPLFRMDQVRAPTLIQFGEKDTSVPTSQGWEHYRALQVLDRAPVRFLVYPGQQHGLRKLSYQRRKIEEEVAWIEHHLFGREPERAEYLKDGSPLAAHIAREELTGGAGGLIGERRNGVLVPPLGSTALSSGARMARVELTRAMLAPALENEALRELAVGLIGFEGDIESYAAGGNLPATGASPALARAYASWLTELTGEPWRLPTVAEMGEALEATPHSPLDNNLCRWAGYEPTYDEALSLRERMSRDGAVERWLLPVGTGDPEAEWRDLHGNAREYAQDPGNAEELRGEGALSSCEETAGEIGSAISALAGIRLVRDP